MRVQARSLFECIIFGEMTGLNELCGGEHYHVERLSASMPPGVRFPNKESGFLVESQCI